MKKLHTIKPVKRTHTFAFDFDGVIAHYTGFKGHHHLGVPNKEVVKAIRILKLQGHKVLIYSTRGNAQLRKYCKMYDIPIDYFNENPKFKTKNPGKVLAFAYIDDRAVRYKGQSAETLVRTLNRFRTHWE